MLRAWESCEAAAWSDGSQRGDRSPRWMIELVYMTDSSSVISTSVLGAAVAELSSAPPPLRTDSATSDASPSSSGT